MARLKKKDELNYRRGYTHSHCGDCDFFVPDFRVMGIGGEFLRYEPRCKEIGLRDGRMYRVSRNNICDLFDNTETIRRIRGC